MGHAVILDRSNDAAPTPRSSSTWCRRCSDSPYELLMWALGETRRVLSPGPQIFHPLEAPGASCRRAIP